MPYQVTYLYGGDANFNGVTDNTTTTLTVIGNRTGYLDVSSTKPPGAYGVGTMIPISLTFNSWYGEQGEYTQLALYDGGVATCTSGSGSSLTFTYTVLTGQNTMDLDYASTGALTLNNGSIDDSAGNLAMLRSAPATSSDGLAAQNIVIDTTTPAVATYRAPSVTMGGGTTETFAVAYADNVAVNSTLNINDVLVTGPNGYSQLATYLG